VNDDAPLKHREFLDFYFASRLYLAVAIFVAWRLRMFDKPAILGGKPRFDHKINIVRPVLPDYSELQNEIQSILSSGMVTKGRYLNEFEEAIQDYLKVKHAVAVSSCTSGLMLTHKSLGLTGDVVVPSFTFMATVSSLVWNGLNPIFADVDIHTTNLSPEAAEAAITPDTSAILAVHNFGNPAEIDALQAVADRHGIHLIFDAAHGFGALYKGQPLGPQGEANIFSMSPTKLLITGEGGIVATNNSELAARIRLGREYGNNGNYDSLIAGLNARMPELNAILGLKSLERLEDAAQSRNETAALYQEMMGHLPGIDFQRVRTEDRCSYKDFSITVDATKFGLSRDDLAVALTEENIDTRKYYDPPAHRQMAYQSYDDRRPLPNTNWLAANSLSFPLWSNMENGTTTGICEAMEKIFTHREAVRAKLRGITG
jgi:dTDP-4-amino-4,6-dideoxygalactose transaminase